MAYSTYSTRRMTDTEVFYIQFDLHLIVDEVFANEVFSSSYSPHPTPFISVLSLDIPGSYCDPARIHVLASPTKDFGASGVLVGALISQHNQDVINVVASSLWAAPISSPSDAVFTAIMNDEAYCDWYLQENRTRLARAFELLAEWCEFHKLPCVCQVEVFFVSMSPDFSIPDASFVRAEAALFALVDFGPIILTQTDPALPLHERVQEAASKMMEAGVRLVRS